MPGKHQIVVGHHRARLSFADNGNVCAQRPGFVFIRISFYALDQNIVDVAELKNGVALVEPVNVDTFAISSGLPAASGGFLSCLIVLEDEMGVSVSTQDRTLQANLIYDLLVGGNICIVV